jgi:hypothetical protein
VKVCVSQWVFNSREEELAVLLDQQNTKPRSVKGQSMQRKSKHGLERNKEWKSVVNQEQELERSLGLHGF